MLSRPVFIVTTESTMMAMVSWMDKTSCAANGTGERLAECGDGIDNDGDGQIDSRMILVTLERNKEGDVHGDGPFHVACHQLKKAGNLSMFSTKAEPKYWSFRRRMKAQTGRCERSGPDVEELMYRNYGGESTQHFPA